MGHLDQIMDEIEAKVEELNNERREENLPPFVVQARQEAEENHLLGRPVDEQWIRKRALQLYEGYKAKNGIEADLEDGSPENGITSEWYSEEDAQRLVEWYKERIRILESTKPASPPPLTLASLSSEDHRTLWNKVKEVHEKEIKDRVAHITKDGLKNYIEGITSIGVVLVINAFASYFPGEWKALAIIPMAFLFYRVHKIMKRFKKSLDEIDEKIKISPEKSDDSVDSSSSP